MTRSIIQHSVLICFQNTNTDLNYFESSPYPAIYQVLLNAFMNVPLGDCVCIWHADLLIESVNYAALEIVGLFNNNSVELHTYVCRKGSCTKLHIILKTGYKDRA